MLLTRILSALVMGVLFALALFGLSDVAWSAAMLLVIGAAAVEWSGLARLGSTGRYAFVLLVVLLCLGGALWSGLAWGDTMPARLGWVYWIAALFWLLGVPLWLWRLPTSVSSFNVAALGLPVLVPAYLAMLQLRTLGAWVLLGIMAIAWIADTAAYGFGRWLGRHRLAPRVSPGKTWEGVFGALLTLGLYILILCYWLDPSARDAAQGAAQAGWWSALGWLLAATGLLAVASILGDLFESSLKRHAGVKDSGWLIPGHGGVLDRLDSQFALLPLAAWLILLSPRLP